MSGAACASLLGTRARSYFAWAWAATTDATRRGRTGAGALSPLIQKMTAVRPPMPLLLVTPSPLLLSLRRSLPTPPLVAAERQL